MDASRGGDNRRQEGVTQALSRVALPIFINQKVDTILDFCVSFGDDDVGDETLAG